MNCFLVSRKTTANEIFFMNVAPKKAEILVESHKAKSPVLLIKRSPRQVWFLRQSSELGVNSIQLELQVFVLPLFAME